MSLLRKSREPAAAATPNVGKIHIKPEPAAACPLPPSIVRQAAKYTVPNEIKELQSRVEALETAEPAKPAFEITDQQWIDHTTYVTALERRIEALEELKLGLRMDKLEDTGYEHRVVVPNPREGAIAPPPTPPTPEEAAKRAADDEIAAMEAEVPEPEPETEDPEEAEELAPEREAEELAPEPEATDGGGYTKEQLMEKRVMDIRKLFVEHGVNIPKGLSRKEELVEAFLAIHKEDS